MQLKNQYNKNIYNNKNVIMYNNKNIIIIKMFIQIFLIIFTFKI